MKQSDVQRWEKTEALFEDWNQRTNIMAQYIGAHDSVLEFGAAKLALKQFIPETVKYTPSDIVDRGEGTIVCDLNRKPYPEFNRQDVIFFSGVLEYVFDIPDLVQFLSTKTNKFIISYCTFDSFSSQENRKINGWVNQYTNLEIINIFKENTFELIETKTWRKQNIYVFKK
ncbi:hypothetical protein CW732_09065 [Olleya sp. Bg11-27]|nr:hypothetical protein CW732_09065 [Olleya sp. Bg11-27]